MKHVFVINPSAGQGEIVELELAIRRTGNEMGVDYEIHITENEADAEDFVRSKCKKEPSAVRFYACGGDGTVEEVANGIYGSDNAELAIIPKGTGNDFIRSFPDGGDFRDVKAQILGKAIPCDMIRYNGVIDGKIEERGCCNMINIGLDCDVVDEARHFKHHPLFKGRLAYLAGVGKVMIKMKGTDLKIEFDDGYVYDGPLLLIAIANGNYCGMGVKGVPLALTNDGLIDASIIARAGRLSFVRMYPKYSKGTHLDTKFSKKNVIYKKCERMTITPKTDVMKVSFDGEIKYTEKLDIRMEKDALMFNIPAKL